MSDEAFYTPVQIETVIDSKTDQEVTVSKEGRWKEMNDLMYYLSVQNSRRAQCSGSKRGITSSRLDRSGRT